MNAKSYAGLAVAGLLAATLSACGGGGGSHSKENDIAQIDVQHDDSDAALPARYGRWVSAPAIASAC